MLRRSVRTGTIAAAVMIMSIVGTGTSAAAPSPSGSAEQLDYWLCMLQSGSALNEDCFWPLR